jgi:hypothetical protein
MAVLCPGQHSLATLGHLGIHDQQDILDQLVQQQGILEVRGLAILVVQESVILDQLVQ